MYQLLLFIGFVSTISCAIAEKPEYKEVDKALIAYAVSPKENGQTVLLNGTVLGKQWCSLTTYCDSGLHCCSATTCCLNWQKCCGGGRYCCSSATSARSTAGLIFAAVLLYFGISLMQSKN